MEEPNPPSTIAEVIQLLAQQQAAFQTQLQEQVMANNSRMEAMAFKPPAARKAAPPTYQGTLDEDLVL